MSKTPLSSSTDQLNNIEVCRFKGPARIRPFSAALKAERQPGQTAVRLSDVMLTPSIAFFSKKK